MKLLSAILAALMVFTLASCSGGTDAPVSGGETNRSVETTTAEETTASYLETLGERNCEGASYVILDANDYPATHINMPVEINGDVINDALYNRNSFISDKYNVSIEYVQLTNAANGIKTLKNSVLAGEKAYNITISTILGGTLGQVATEGILTNLLDMPYMSLDSNWWSPLMYESLQLNGKLYYTTGDISPVMYLAPFCIFMNKNLLEDYGIDTNLYQLVYDGVWTLDEFINIAKDKTQDLNGDGKIHTDDDFYGFIHQTNTLTTNGLLAGAGVKLSENTDGTVKVDLMSERTIAVVEKLQLLTDNIKYTQQNDILDYTFKEGRAIAVSHLVGSASVRFRDMEDDYAILPMPKYDSEQDSYYSLVNAWCDSYIGIPVTTDMDFTGFITEVMGYHSYETIRPQVYDVTFKNKAVRDEDSANMLDIIFNTQYLDFNALYNFGGSTDAVNKAIINESSYASAYAAVEGKIQGAVDELVEAWG